MAKRKKGGQAKKVEPTNTAEKPAGFEPFPPKPRFVLAILFGLLAFGWLGYLLVIAIVSAY
ncbi:MAG: hypothetical protein NXI22_01635 [bacterium]|nr:hypothetical protein [bacterium]